MKTPTQRPPLQSTLREMLAQVSRSAGSMGANSPAVKTWPDGLTRQAVPLTQRFSRRHHQISFCAVPDPTNDATRKK